MIGIIKEPYFMGWWKKGIKRTHLSKIPPRTMEDT